MKKVFNTLLIIVVVVMFANVSAYSQGTKSKTYKNAITTDPIDLLISERIGVKYEQVIGKKNSFIVSLMYDYSYNTDKYNNLGITIGGEYRWYFHNLFPEIRTKGITGLSVGPIANLTLVRNHANENTIDNNFVFDVGAGVAYKFVLFEGLAIEPAIRFGIRVGSNNTDFKPWPGVTIGYAW